MTCPLVWFLVQFRRSQHPTERMRIDSSGDIQTLADIAATDSTPIRLLAALLQMQRLED